jgi:predicted NUDIX family NTP pyrophosphohydrolase
VAARVSAGILLFRRPQGRLEVLLVHPGGPFFRGKDLGYWSIPKGEPDDPDEDLELAARREFEEETGQPVPAGPLIPLGTITQRGGKVVRAWAVEGDIDPATMSSNLVEMRWPPLAGREIRFPEVDRWVYFEPAEARRRIKDTQLALLERLADALSGAPETSP